MRARIGLLTEEVTQLRQQLKLKVDNEIPFPDSKVTASRYELRSSAEVLIENCC